MAQKCQKTQHSFKIRPEEDNIKKKSRGSDGGFAAIRARSGEGGGALFRLFECLDANRHYLGEKKHCARSVKGALGRNKADIWRKTQVLLLLGTQVLIAHVIIAKNSIIVENP